MSLKQSLLGLTKNIVFLFLIINSEFYNGLIAPTTLKILSSHGNFRLEIFQSKTLL